VAEQFTFKQFGRDRGAIDRNERRVRAVRHLVDEIRHQLLARTGLAQDEHSLAGLRHQPDEIEQLLERFARTHHAQGFLMFAAHLFELLLEMPTAFDRAEKGRDGVAEREQVFQVGFLVIRHAGAARDLYGADGVLADVNGRDHAGNGFRRGASPGPPRNDGAAAVGETPAHPGLHALYRAAFLVVRPLHEFKLVIAAERHPDGVGREPFPNPHFEQPQ